MYITKKELLGVIADFAVDLGIDSNKAWDKINSYLDYKEAEEGFKKAKEKMSGAYLVQKMKDIKNQGAIQKTDSKTKIDLKIESYNVDENCEHYLPRQKQCLWCGGQVNCCGKRDNCESSMEKRIEEMCLQLGIKNGKVNGYVVKDGLVVGKE